MLSFPEYYFGQIATSSPRAGTVAYSRDLQLALLQETTEEMARNGCKKIIIINGHGGNESLLPYFLNRNWTSRTIMSSTCSTSRTAFG